MEWFRKNSEIFQKLKKLEIIEKNPDETLLDTTKSINVSPDYEI